MIDSPFPLSVTWEKIQWILQWKKYSKALQVFHLLFCIISSELFEVFLLWSDALSDAYRQEIGCMHTEKKELRTRAGQIEQRLSCWLTSLPFFWTLKLNSSTAGMNCWILGNACFWLLQGNRGNLLYLEFDEEPQDWRGCQGHSHCHGWPAWVKEAKLCFPQNKEQENKSI